MLPIKIKEQLITSYLFSDQFFSSFRRFFDFDTKDKYEMLYDISMGMAPRHFDPEEKILYDEDQEVAEMYFVEEGFIGIGFSMMQNGMTGRNYVISKRQQGKQLICDHYVVNKQRSQFIYIVLRNTRAFAISSKFLHRVFFPEYPDFEIKVKSRSYSYYKKWIFKPVNQHRIIELKQMNKKRHTYSEIIFNPKNLELKKIPTMSQYQQLAYLPKTKT